MVTRGTPKDIERYIKICDEDNIYKLSVKGYFPRYIDDSFAYFEYTKDLVNAISEIINDLNDGVEK